MSNKTEQEKKLWAQVINDSKWYDGTPQGMIKLSEHLNDLFLSYRDKFAMDFCKYTLKKLDSAPYNIDAIKDELDLYKHSLIK